MRFILALFMVAAMAAPAFAEEEGPFSSKRFVWFADAGAWGYEQTQLPDGWNQVGFASRFGIGWVANPRLALNIGSDQDWTNKAYQANVLGGFYVISKEESDIFRVAIWVGPSYLFGSGNERFLENTHITWRIPIVAGYNIGGLAWVKLIPYYDMTHEEFGGLATIGLSDAFAH